jgi:hypothetical protein
MEVNEAVGVGLERVRLVGSKAKLKPVVKLNWETPASKLFELKYSKFAGLRALFEPVKG